MSTCFIADLHLSASQPETVERFLHFLESDASRHDALYILGDLFEIWLGDDLSAPESESILQALHGVTSSGTPIYIQHGNRDFLLGERFEQQSGCKLISDPYLLETDGSRILLMHGDQLCIDDTSYQRYRNFIRNPLIQWIMLHLPISIRTRIGQKLRARSDYDKGEKTQEIMDVTKSEVIHTMSRWKSHTLIHGHTHRPAIHHLEPDGEPAIRIVLGDWESENNVVIYSNGKFIQQSI
ncbi:MAG: UDP-2,3-diacylglucosamine diphosphatase [Gammaproteobacteria bacterium]|uniref:UDP-2,3-diacylglucosamine hydrolase n=1 Tax=Candidatus Thiopontia autotrophica TaxID=2841688 RepID=A0A8J6P6U2_9GAMM|nr:UDP-2,3-diacylglucosamine diphosphatase [Candidatus Thiopontia autotrophica]MBL6969468.1 UDP-2,3-diacylglucosamine diphosphatase [Gammaproteobacteria bacterium]